jgi:oxygen-independent coproporphyrinogen-3 oxidase
VDEDSRLGLEILQQGARYGAGQRPSDELTVELYEHAVDRLAELGLPRYEISNFARADHASVHNLKYWRLEPYAGFGADAHGFDGRIRRQNVESAAEYVERAARGESQCVAETQARGDEERFFVGLRLAEGVRARASDWSRYGGPIHRFLDAGLLERDGDRLRLTRQGVLLSNEVFQEFVCS